MGSPSWRHADSVAMTNGSDVVTGSGTDWVTGAPVVLPGFALSVDGIYYEVVEVRSDTELQIYPAYAGTTGAKTVTIIEFGRQGVEGAKKRLADVLQTVPAAGRQLYVGTGAPSSGLGNDGALMVDTSNAVLYGPKSGGAWPTGVSLRGPEKRRNLLINSNGEINQRGYVSGAAVTAFQKTIDRWRVVTAGQNLSWTLTNGIRTFTAPAGGVEQLIEGVLVADGNYTLSFTGTATCTVNGTIRASGSTFTLTGGSGVLVRFSGGTFSMPQLEPGSVATPYELPNPAIEQAMCEWYFYRLRTGLFGYQEANAGPARNIADFQIPPMRAGVTASISTMPTLENCSSLALEFYAGQRTAGLTVTVTAAGAYRAYGGVYDFDAEIM